MGQDTAGVSDERAYGVDHAGSGIELVRNAVKPNSAETCPVEDPTQD